MLKHFVTLRFDTIAWHTKWVACNLPDLKFNGFFEMEQRK